MRETPSFDPEEVHSSSDPRPDTVSGETGFSLIEILVALAVTGILVVMLGTLVNSVGRNTVLLREQGRFSEDLVALRRLFHRDIRQIEMEHRINVKPNGFTFKTAHALLQDHPLDVEVSWFFDSGEIRRTEESVSLGYKRTVVLRTGLASWGLEFMERGQKTWRRAETGVKKGAGALRLALVFDGSEPVQMVERCGT